MNQKKSWFVIIMAGGKGERFWPLSREKSPKHLLCLFGKRSLLQQCFDRVLPVVSEDHILVITNAEQAFQVQKQLPNLPKENIISEPCARDTCAAVTLGAAVVGQRSKEAVTAIVPADHLICDEEKFEKTLRDCFHFASQNRLIVTIGIEPTEAATGYGYIQKGEQISLSSQTQKCSTPFLQVEQFVEKPDPLTAAEYVRCGKYLWNAGIFLWSFRTITEALQRHQPHMYNACFRWMKFVDDHTSLTKSLTNEITQSLTKEIDREYHTFRRLSIDYALMEKAENVVVAEADFDWDDLGVWTALERHLPSDPFGNCAVGNMIHIDAKGNLIFDARSKKSLIALVGIKDSIIVQTDEVTMITSKYDAQKIKELVKLIRDSETYHKLI